MLTVHVNNFKLLVTQKSTFLLDSTYKVSPKAKLTVTTKIHRVNHQALGKMLLEKKKYFF